MTEIDLAQRQLLDDETQLQSSSALTVHFPAIERQQRHHHDKPATQVSIPDTVKPPSSYNFDSFLVNSTPSATGCNSPTKAAAKTAKTSQAEGCQRQGLRRSPLRSKSMEIAPLSPHDTEPMSSLSFASPKLGRAKTDNSPGSPLRQVQVPLTSTLDDLAKAVVAVEIPMLKEKSRPKRDQGILEDGEVTLLKAQGGDMKAAVDNDARDGSLTIPDTQSEKGTINTDAAKEQGHPSVPLESLPAVKKKTSSKEATRKSRTTPATEPKKKKLKRGKTSSAALKKTYESDVEDDVIWIDERLFNPEPQVHNTAEAPSSTKLTAKNNFRADDCAGKDKVKSNPETALLGEQTRKEPKKQARKRKKTSEQDTVDREAEQNTGDPKGDKSIALQDISNKGETEHNRQKQQGETHLDTVSSTQKIALDETAIPTHVAHLETPQKRRREGTDGEARSNATKVTPDKDWERGPDKHSPIARAPVRVGLSRRAHIAPLLKVVKR